MPYLRVGRTITSRTFSPVLSDSMIPSEDIRRRSASCSPDSSTLVITTMVPSTARADLRHFQTPPATSTAGTGTTQLSGTEHIRSLEAYGIHGQAAGLYCASLRSSTTSLYSTCWQRWIKWCNTREVNPTEATVAQIIDFFTELFQESKEYSTPNSYRSAVSAIHTASIGQDITLIHFMQGVFNSRPPKPRYTQIWDVYCVLYYMKQMDDPDHLYVQKLSQKVVILMALSNADRASDLHLLSIDHMWLGEEEVRFQVNGLSKTRKS